MLQQSRIQLVLEQANLVLIHSIMLALPRMPMLSKRLGLWLGNPWKHAHLDDGLAFVVWRNRLYRAIDMVSNDQIVQQEDTTYFPQVLQKYLSKGVPLPVLVSLNDLRVPFRSSILTLSSSMIRLDDTKLPATLRQFWQWQRCPRGLEKSSLSVIVTWILPQRQLPVIDSANLLVSCWFGFPVNSGIVYCSSG